MSLTPFRLSVLLHGIIFVILFSILKFPLEKKERVEFEIYKSPKPSAEPLLKISPAAPPRVESEPPKNRKVFGLARRALVAKPEEATADAPTVKAGNTLAKENDNLILQSTDDDQLPIPTDDFLVSTMPQIESEFRIPYPNEAKLKNIEGPVIMDLLIDAKGQVRKVDVVSGPGYGLNEAAALAIKQFKFRPAKVKEDFVAVKIRYTYRFILEKR